MRDAIAERAKRNGRSMNSEIVQILEDALKTELIAWDEDLKPEAGDEIFSMSIKQLNKMVSVAAEDTAQTVVNELLKKYDLTPKK